MYKMVPFSDDLDLTYFYVKCAKKGFVNNSSQYMLVDCFKNEKEKQTWILYYNGVAAGSVACHSFPEMGKDAYRIAARSCVLTDELPRKSLFSLKSMVNNQNVTAQFFMTTCIQWAGLDKKHYVTTNAREGGSQRLVHSIVFPNLEKVGMCKNVGNIDYRGSEQTVWHFNPTVFYKDLEKYGRWQETF